ncbi:hypothetical protein DPMN_043240 [Dreissena polymorpha]|uniref:Uncharacterized protein n=1 Tax=Dreissena polymorpha TaxID=45954 RepID=A0A9D4D0L3_DREPO|nr:hypothetical protein DPMN_043240 [Dreissena polymorpha]
MMTSNTSLIPYDDDNNDDEDDYGKNARMVNLMTVIMVKCVFTWKIDANGNRK